MNSGFDDLLGGNEDAGFFDGEDAGPDLFGEVAPTAPSPPEPERPVSRPSAASPEPYSKPQTDGYVVLARKYRPQTFDDVVGQHAVQQGLRGAIASGQISHSYLFSGPRGTGKTSTARILAKALNCQDNGPRPDPCGKCASCRSITAGSSLDVIEIDAASNTGVDNIRELKSGVVLAPFSRYKVYIVDEVHMLSNQAFNALLKTLEEPPPQVVFVLATTELHKVPETIISRCQTFMFRRFSLEELKRQLGNILDIEVAQRGLSVESEDREKILDLVARNAEGGMRDAQVTLDQVLVLSKGRLNFEDVRRFLGMADLEALDKFIQMIYAKQAKELLELIDTLVGQGQDLELFVKGASDYLRDLMIVRAAGKDTSLINASEDRMLELETIAGKLSLPFLIETIEQFVHIVGEMKTSGQPRTVLELAVLKVALGNNGLSLDGLNDRLNRLEARIDSGVAMPKQAEAPVEKPVDKPAETALSRAPLSEPAQKKTLVQDKVPPSVATEGGSVLARLVKEIEAGNSMLALSFEQAVTAFQFEGKTLTLYLDPGQGFSAAKVQQVQSMAIIINAARVIYGEDVLVKIQIGAESKGGTSPRPDESKSEKAASAIAAMVKSTERAERDNPEPAEVTADSEPEERDLRIYYPEEIRQKAMLELGAQEFQDLLKNDNNLRALVEKAKAVFGVDDTNLRYHRSTLA